MDKIVIVLSPTDRANLSIPASPDFQIALCNNINEGVRALEMVNGQVSAFIYNSLAIAAEDWEALDKANIRYPEVVWVAYLGGNTSYTGDLAKAFKNAYKEGPFDVDEVVMTLNSVVPSAT